MFSEATVCTFMKNCLHDITYQQMNLLIKHIIIVYCVSFDKYTLSSQIPGDHPNAYGKYLGHIPKPQKASG